MKHIDKKIRFAGANFKLQNARYRRQLGLPPLAGAGTAGAGGGGRGPVFRPPKLGEMQYGASYSFLETLDLISDGPIQGLVNKNGEVVNGEQMLQGIYLNETPVAVTQKNDPTTSTSSSLFGDIFGENPNTVASVTGAIPFTGMFDHLSNSNSNDLIVAPEGQLTNFTGKAESEAPNWSEINSDEHGDVHTFNSNSAVSNGLVYGGIARKYNPETDESTTMEGTVVSVKNDFPRFALYMGNGNDNFSSDSTTPPKAVLINQSASVASTLERKNSSSKQAKYKSYLVYSDLSDLTKSINTTESSFAASGTIDLNDGVYTFTNVAVNGFIQEASNTDIVEDRVYRVEFTIFDYSSGAIKVRRPFTSDIVSGNGTFKFTAKSTSSGSDAGKLMLQIQTAAANFKIKDIFIYDVTDDGIPTNYTSLISFGNQVKNGLNFDELKVGSGHVYNFFSKKKGDISSAKKLAQILSAEFVKLVTLKNNAEKEVATGGKYQVDLVDKALNKLGDFLTVTKESIAPPKGHFTPNVKSESIAGSTSQSDWRDALTNFLIKTEKEIFIAYRPIETQAGLNFSIVDSTITDKHPDGFEYKSIIDYSFRYETSEGTDLSILANNDSNLEIFDFLVPLIDKDGVLTGEVRGFYLICLKDRSAKSSILKSRGKEQKYSFQTEKRGISSGLVNTIKNISTLKYKQTTAQVIRGMVNNQKFNYSNVLAELKLGTEDQSPFKFFNKIYIDKPYDSFLYGPYRVDPDFKVQRIVSDASALSEFDFNTTLAEGDVEGSTDLRTGAPLQDDSTNFLNYSDWADGLRPPFNEPSTPVTHTVYNPNVEEVFVTLDIQTLRDTLHTEIKPSVLSNEEDPADRKLTAGVNYPALLEVRISTGLIDPKTNKKTKNGEVRDYHFVALVNSSVLVDLGNPESSPTDFPWVKLDSFQGTSVEQNKINTPIKLPPAIRVGAAGVGEGNEEVPHRFVEVEKISCETNSVLLARNVVLSKVSEIIPVNLSYPFSAIVGTKLDSRSIDGVPVRNFDCKLKLVKIPSNYNPTKLNGEDKRYYSSEDEFNNTAEADKKVYDGDWDGTFHEELRWTDNPAWILYDLLTNKRYGLGDHVDEDTINIWELYKIGRFCDAVNDDGVFVGVSDGQGGLEPRFACNIMFNNNEKIYDALYTIAALFRGSIFFSDNQINFVDDRPRSPICLITNESIKGGMFNYSNNRRDEIYNTVEITYNDRFDDFLPKIETVEDEEDIRRRGVFKTRIQGVGMTSRGMARRAAAHLLFHKVNENQTITFQAGLPSLLYRPGDIIEVQDELKSNLINFGRVLAVDADKQEIRISNTFDNTQMSGRLTIFNPTGIDTIADLNTIAEKNRERAKSSFNISGDLASSSSTAVWTANFTGDYNFSGYRQGYTGTEGGFEEYAAYTGTGSNILYFDTTLTGWVFATGGSFERDNSFAKFISATTTIGQNTKLKNFSTGDVKNYDTSASDNRGSNTFDLEHSFSGDFNDDSFTNGILESEIDVNSPSQIDVITITGSTVNQAFGTLASGIEQSKTGLLQNIKVGSPCSFQKSGASPVTYKVLEIAEVNTNEFATVASLYESGKYDLIESDKSITTLSNTFSYQNASSQVNDLIYHNLSPVRSLTFSTGDVPEAEEFFISGSWTDPNGSNAIGYQAILQTPTSKDGFDKTTENTFVVFSGGLKEDVGTYSLRVKALGAGADNSLALNAYYDSTFAVHNKFLVPEENLNHDESFLENFTIN